MVRHTLATDAIGSFCARTVRNARARAAAAAANVPKWASDIYIRGKQDRPAFPPSESLIMSNVIKKVFNTDKAENEASKVASEAGNTTNEGKSGLGGFAQKGQDAVSGFGGKGQDAATGATGKGESVLGDAKDKVTGIVPGLGNHQQAHPEGAHTTSAGATSTGAAATHALNNQSASTGLTGSNAPSSATGATGAAGVTGVHPSESAYGNRSSNLTQTSSVNSGVNVAAGNVDQDVQHLAPVTKHIAHRHEIEELHREREHHIHQHHIQHHVQPVLDAEHLAEQLHSRVVPATTIREVHANTDKDAALLRSVAGNPKDSFTQAATDRSIIDKGEAVREIVHHHIHNIVQPIIEKETHEYHRIRTTIPTTHITHEAPIVHESTAHQPIRKEDFVKGGGVLTSNTRSIDEAGLLNLGSHQRSVEGETYTGGAPWSS